MAIQFHRLAEKFEQKKYYRYAEQLRAAGLSVPNNIAEGSASPHAAEFKQFLNIARRSLFESVSMLLVFEEMGIVAAQDIASLVSNCDQLSRKLTNLSRSR